MKKIKLLVASVTLFLAAGSISAQNDSIYGLEVSKENGIISFYSTYDMTNAEQIVTLSFDGTSDNLLSRSVSYRDESDLDSISFSYYIYWSWSCEKTAENIYKVSVQNDDFMRLLIPEDKLTRIELFISGEGFISPPTQSSFSTASIGNSNVLIYYYNPIETLLMKLEANENYTYKYFLLSGIESTTKPIGVPFIEMIYDNGVLIGKNKYLIGK